MINFRALEFIRKYCEVTIHGVKGMGKTLLSVAIAEDVRQYWKIPPRRRADSRFLPLPPSGLRYRVFANFPTVFRDDYTPDLLTVGLHHSVIILDEAGARQFNSRNFASKQQREALSTMAYSRKRGLVWLFPTATPVDKQLRHTLVVRNIPARIFLDKLGLGDVLWHYIAQNIHGDRVGLFLWCPYAYYGLFDTDAIPGPYEDALFLLVKKFQETYQYNAAEAQKVVNRIVDDLQAGKVVSPPRWDYQRPVVWPVWLQGMFNRVAEGSSFGKVLMRLAGKEGCPESTMSVKGASAPA